MRIFEGLIQLYIKMFHVKGESIIPLLCKLTVPKMVFMAKYKTIVQLSEMDAEEKNMLKIYVNDLFRGETPQFRLDACKIIFTLNQCL